MRQKIIKPIKPTVEIRVNLYCGYLRFHLSRSPDIISHVTSSFFVCFIGSKCEEGQIRNFNI